MRELEKLRNADAIGAPLDAEVDVYCAPHVLQVLQPFGEELRFVFITSAARVHRADSRPAGRGAGGGGRTTTSPGSLRVRRRAKKCVRCWHQRDGRRQQRRASGAVRPLRHERRRAGRAATLYLREPHGQQSAFEGLVHADARRQQLAVAVVLRRAARPDDQGAGHRHREDAGHDRAAAGPRHRATWRTPARRSASSRRRPAGSAGSSSAWRWSSASC